MMDILVLDCES